MAFNDKKFMNTNFQPRTQDVPVPDLKDFFDADTPAIFKVRGLTGPELARTHEAVSKHQDIANLVNGLLSGQSGEKVEAIRKALGINDDVPAEIAKRLEMLTTASIEPKITLDIAVKLCDAYPIEFYEITGAIIALTGKGQVPGKSKPSGETPVSKQP